MDKLLLEKLFSPQRTQKYFQKYPDDEVMAIKHYEANIQLSEAFYPVLSVFEVAMRNSVNRQLSQMFNVPDWYNRFATYPGLSSLIGEVSRAQNYITGRGELVNAPKVVAELTLGFWVRLFNAQYQQILWSELRKAFPYLPRAQRQRHNVSAPLNRIRNFRNRIYHNEPISWSLLNLEIMHLEITTVLSWLSVDLKNWILPLDRFETVLKEVRTKLDQGLILMRVG